MSYLKVASMIIENYLASEQELEVAEILKVKKTGEADKGC